MSQEPKVLKNHIVEPSHDEKSRTTPWCFWRQPNWHLRCQFQMPHSKFPLGTSQESLRKWREPGAKSCQKQQNGALSKGEKSNPLLTHVVLRQAVNRQPGCLRKWREPGAKSCQKPQNGAFSKGEKSNPLLTHLVLRQAVNR